MYFTILPYNMLPALIISECVTFCDTFDSWIRSGFGLVTLLQMRIDIP